MTTQLVYTARRPDRRIRHPLLADWRWALHGRRRRVRRLTDDGLVHLDHIRVRVVVVAVAIMVLSALDAYFTLYLIRAGVVSEANPVMRFFLESDRQLFINIKTAFTAGAVLMLAFCSPLRVFNRIKVEKILTGALVVYVGLMAYHLTLLVRAGLV